MAKHKVGVYNGSAHWEQAGYEAEMPGPRPISSIANYHAHIYYDVDRTRHVAETLRKQIAARFRVRIGAWHDEKVGPHARSMFQVAFDTEVFPAFVPWLMLNRSGLTVLVHPNTDHPRDDHLVHALWLGEKLPVDAAMLEDSLAALGRMIPPVVPNTDPDPALI
jgi:DOPA 4,5-dioxygenase